MKVTTHYVAFWALMVLSNTETNKPLAITWFVFGLASLASHYWITKDVK